MKAGDVLLCAASALHGVCPQGAGGELLVMSFISTSARPQLPADEEDGQPLPEWAKGLGEAEQALLMGGGSTRVLLSDGHTTWLSDADDAEVAQRASSPLEGGSTDDAAERWAFDTHGYLLAEGVMDEDWIEAAVAGIDANLDRMVYRGVGDVDNAVTLAKIPGAPTISGAGRPDLRDLFQLPAPHNEPFLKMLAHPAIIQRLNWMIGAGYRVTQNTALCHVKGSSGQMLHSGNTNPTIIGKHYEMVNGRVHTKSGINVAWQLNDVKSGDGGFVVIPGSHKSTTDPDPEVLKRKDLFQGAIQVCAPAGTAVLFHNALWHSGGPWSKPDGERVILYYAYEHPWMIASAEHWGYKPDFYNRLPLAQRKLFHGFVFDPPEYRWG